MPLKITFEDNEINEYLRLDAGQEARTLENMRAAATIEAEEFLNHDFSLIVTDTATGLTTVTPVEAPAPVKDWVLNRIAEKFENRGKQPKVDYAALKPFRRLPFRG